MQREHRLSVRLGKRCTRRERRTDADRRAHAEALLHERLELLRVLAKLEPRPRAVLARARRRDERNAVVAQVRRRGLGLLARERDACPLDARVAHERLHPVERRGARVERHDRHRRRRQTPDAESLLHPVGELAVEPPRRELELVGIDRAVDPRLDRPQPRQRLAVQAIDLLLRRRAFLAPGEEVGVVREKLLIRVEQLVLEDRQRQRHPHEVHEVGIGAGRLLFRELPPLRRQAAPSRAPRDRTARRTETFAARRRADRTDPKSRTAAGTPGAPSGRPRRVPRDSVRRAPLPCRRRSRSGTA